MRTLSRRREEYVGEWLPEPLLTSPDIVEDVELAESVSMAMLAVLETLAPIERAVFVLHQVFDLPHADAVAKLLAWAHRVLAAFETTSVWLNGAPAARVEIDGQVAAVSLVVDTRRITRLYAMANPHKLTRLDRPSELVR